MHVGTWNVQRMLLISDANIFIDFDCCGLIAELFQVPNDIAVPDVLFIEELEERHPGLPDMGLPILSVSEQGVSYAEKLQLQYIRPSPNDLLALSLARELSCPLVTGDNHLRKAALAEKVELKGTLWLMQRMIEKGIVSIDAATAAFKTMREEKRRLPWNKVKQMLDSMR